MLCTYEEISAHQKLMTIPSGRHDHVLPGSEPVLMALKSTSSISRNQKHSFGTNNTQCSLTDQNL